jgi:hypothetical protein
MRRPQFSLKTLLWLMVVVGFLAGIIAQRRQQDLPFNAEVGGFGDWSARWSFH